MLWDMSRADPSEASQQKLRNLLGEVSGIKSAVNTEVFDAMLMLFRQL